MFGVMEVLVVTVDHQNSQVVHNVLFPSDAVLDDVNVVVNVYNTPVLDHVVDIVLQGYVSFHGTLFRRKLQNISRVTVVNRALDQEVNNERVGRGSEKNIQEVHITRDDKLYPVNVALRVDQNCLEDLFPNAV